MEIGSPMASMNLLGNPDHYTSHDFVPFYWRNYVAEVQKAYEEKEEEINNNNFKEVADVKQENLGVTGIKIKDTQKALMDLSISDTKVSIVDNLSSAELTKSGDPLYSVVSKEENGGSGAENLEHKDKIYIVKVNSNVQTGTCTEEKTNIKPDPAGLHANPDTQNGDGASVECERSDKLGLADKDTDVSAEDKPSIKLDLLDAISRPGIEDPPNDEIDKTLGCIEAPEKVIIRKYKDYGFSKQDFKVMGNFNLRYECNDARDDYYAQKKKEQDHLGRKTLWARAQMNEAENIMVQSGWLDKALDGIQKLDVT
ncbi:hypothetical protein DXG01_000914, partial [Tephrocybe rancida]